MNGLHPCRVGSNNSDHARTGGQEFPDPTGRTSSSLVSGDLSYLETRRSRTADGDTRIGSTSPAERLSCRMKGGPRRREAIGLAGRRGTARDLGVPDPMSEKVTIELPD